MNRTTHASVVLVVVEDTDEDFDTVVEAVTESGVSPEVRRALTADAALTLIRDLAPMRPVVVLMDLNTPGTDGRETLAILKADPALKAIPVLVFSTSANPRDIEFCYAAGANAYHVKPVRYPDHLQCLIEIVRYWFGRVAVPAAAGRHA